MGWLLIDRIINWTISKLMEVRNGEYHFASLRNYKNKNFRFSSEIHVLIYWWYMDKEYMCEAYGMCLFKNCRENETTP